MSQPRIKISVETSVTVTLSIEEVRLLGHLTDFKLHKWFVDNCSRKITSDELTDKLKALRDAIVAATDAHREATDLLWSKVQVHKA